MRLPNASQYEPAIDPSTTISQTGTRELRLFLEGESAASLPPVSQPTQTAPSFIASSNQTPQAGGSLSGTYLFLSSHTFPADFHCIGRIKEGYINKADSNKKMKKVWVTLDKNFIYFYKTALVYTSLLCDFFLSFYIIFQDKNPTERISLYCATPKLSTDAKKKSNFDLLTVTNTYSFSADSELEVPHFLLPLL